MRTFLITWCLWLLAKLGYTPPPCVHIAHGMVCYPPPFPELYAAAVEWVVRLEPRPESGEWKRHQVYAALLKQFPGIPKAVVARAIEDAKCGLG